MSHDSALLLVFNKGAKLLLLLINATSSTPSCSNQIHCSRIAWWTHVRELAWSWQGQTVVNTHWKEGLSIHSIDRHFVGHIFITTNVRQLTNAWPWLIRPYIHGMETKVETNFNNNVHCSRTLGLVAAKWRLTSTQQQSSCAMEVQPWSNANSQHDHLLSNTCLNSIATALWQTTMQTCETFLAGPTRRKEYIRVSTQHCFNCVSECYGSQLQSPSRNKRQIHEQLHAIVPLRC